MEKIVQIAIAILLFLCLLHFPYAYYQMVRFVATAAFIYLAVNSENKNLQIIFIVLAVLFQPLLKIPLGRTIWNILDVLVGLFLLILSFKKPTNRP